MFRFIVVSLLICGALADSLHPERHDLNEKQSDLIKKTWPSPSQAQDWAVNLILKYFKAYPEAHAGYPKFKSISLDQLRNTPEFRTHAMKVYDFFDTGVRFVRAGPSKGGHCKPLEDRSEYYVKHGLTNRQHFVDFRQVLIEHLGVSGDEKLSWDYFLDNIYALIFSKFPQ